MNEMKLYGLCALALALQASNSCPDFSDPEGAGAGARPGPAGAEGSRSGGLFGPTTGRGRVTFGQARAGQGSRLQHAQGIWHGAKG
jgi:hypothetical protein